MTALPYRSGGLLMPFNPDLHLFAILNDPCPQKHCLVVMVTSLKPKRAHDATCILEAGDHPFVTRQSYLLYRMADTIRADQIRTRIGQNMYIPKEDFAPPVFKRIADGLYNSEETRGRILRYAEANEV